MTVQTPEKNVEKVKLYGGLAYWSRILLSLDKKLETICKGYGYGQIGLSIIIHNGKIMYTLFTDEIKIKETMPEK